MAPQTFEAYAIRDANDNVEMSDEDKEPASRHWPVLHTQFDHDTLRIDPGSRFVRVQITVEE